VSNLPTKIERAFRNYMILQGHGTADTSFISLDSALRVAQSRTFIVKTIEYRNGARNQGKFHIEIQHVWGAFQDITQDNADQNRIELQKMIEGTESAMFAQSDGQGPLTKVCDAITLAGRDLAVNTAAAGSPPWQAWENIRLANLDMAWFRLDDLFAAPVYITRGNTETAKGLFWCEIRNFTGFASSSNEVLPN
jgi:hypothetical protein